MSTLRETPIQMLISPREGGFQLFRYENNIGQLVVSLALAWNDEEFEEMSIENLYLKSILKIPNFEWKLSTF